LPSINRKELWKDLKIVPPAGVIRREVLKGIENKSLVNIFFSGDFDWSPWEVHKFSAMVEVMNIKLREIIREEMSGTYGVRVNQILQKYPIERYMASISFGCDPNRVDELVKSIFDQIDSLKRFTLDESYVVKVKETQRREWEVNLKENNFWLNRLWSFYIYDYNLEDFYEYAERIDRLNSEIIQESVNKYFNEENFIQVVLKPEQKN
jgi:zinc protease